MHLSTCVDLFSDSNSLDYHVRSCVSDWLFKSTTEFYGWDNDDLRLNYIFGALCWSYSVAGIMMLLVQPSWTRRSSFPHILFAFILIFVQGPLSFLADYINMTNDSVVHVIDRFMANINLSMQMWKLSTYMYYARPGTFYCHLCAITFAIFSFMNSQDAQHEQDREGFIFVTIAGIVIRLSVS